MNVAEPDLALRRSRSDVTGFGTLGRVHGLSVAGEALVALSLAGSLFFKVDPSEGRDKVLLGLLLTIAPFGLVAPLIGPLIDRVPGGHRVVVVATMVLRTVLAGAMVVAMVDDSVALFPEAFLMLVLAKTYQVSKAALVPTVVTSDEELVEANSKLQLLSGVVTVAAGAPGLVLSLIHPAVTVGAAGLVFGIAAVFATGLAPGSGGPNPDLGSGSSRAGPAESDRDDRARAELRAAPVVSAGAVMAIVRGIVGLTTLLVAFELRGGAPNLTERAAVATMEVAGRFSPRYQVPEIGPPAWHFGVVVALGILGGLAGAAAAPKLRATLSEERILLAAVAFIGVIAAGASLLDGLAALSLLSVAVAFSSSGAKQAFDAVVQRDAPDADRGRLFARFEARFQLAWVLGALPPVAVHMPVGLGSACIVVVAAVALAIGVMGVDRFGSALRTAGRLGRTSWDRVRSRA